MKITLVVETNVVPKNYVPKDYIEYHAKCFAGAFMGKIEMLATSEIVQPKTFVQRWAAKLGWEENIVTEVIVP